MALCGFSKPDTIGGDFMEMLLCSTPANQAHIIEAYFAQDCSFSHPLVRVPSFDYKDACIHSLRGWNSRVLIKALYRVQRILSPESIVRVEASAFDKDRNKLLLKVRQSFRVIIPRFSADIKRIIVLQLQPVDVDAGGRPHQPRTSEARTVVSGPVFFSTSARIERSIERAQSTNSNGNGLDYDGDDEEADPSPASPICRKGKTVAHLQKTPLGAPSSSRDLDSEDGPLGAVQDADIESVDWDEGGCECAADSGCCRNMWFVLSLAVRHADKRPRPGRSADIDWHTYKSVNCQCSYSRPPPPTAGLTRRWMIKSQDDIYPLEELIKLALIWPGGLALQLLQLVGALVVALVVAPTVARK